MIAVVRSGPGLVCERNLTLLQSHLAGVMSFSFLKKDQHLLPLAAAIGGMLYAPTVHS